MHGGSSVGGKARAGGSKAQDRRVKGRRAEGTGALERAHEMSEVPTGALMGSKHNHYRRS